jgi:hypothetical protein
MNLMLILVRRIATWKNPANELCDQMKIALTVSRASISWKLDIHILLYILNNCSGKNMKKAGGRTEQ